MYDTYTKYKDVLSFPHLVKLFGYFRRMDISWKALLRATVISFFVWIVSYIGLSMTFLHADSSDLWVKIGAVIIAIFSFVMSIITRGFFNKETLQLVTRYAVYAGLISGVAVLVTFIYSDAAGYGVVLGLILALVAYALALIIGVMVVAVKSKFKKGE